MSPPARHLHRCPHKACDLLYKCEASNCTETYRVCPACWERVHRQGATRTEKAPDRDAPPR